MTTTPTVSLTTDHLQDAATQLRNAKMDTSAPMQNPRPLGTMPQDGNLSPQLAGMTAQAGDTAQQPQAGGATGGGGCGGGAGGAAGGGAGGNTKAQQQQVETTAKANNATKQA